MADIMVDSVTTGIDLNETKAVEAINRLKSAVKDSTREWQINEAQAKSAEMLFLHQNIAMKVLAKQWKSKKLILLTFQKV